MSYYLALIDDGLMDFQSACGPFMRAESAAKAEDMLRAVRPREWALGAPSDPAAIGSFYVMCLGQIDSLNCVIGPYASVNDAEEGTQQMLAGGGVFEAEDDHFIAVVRYLRQDSPIQSQVAILERVL